MRTVLSAAALLLTLTASSGSRVAPAPPPILGAWRYVGTAPPGFVRQGTEVARLTLRLQHGRLQALVATGRHRYTADGRYVAARHELLLSVPTSAGLVRLRATAGQRDTRMIGIWSDAHGDDGGFVLLRVPPQVQRALPRRRR